MKCKECNTSTSFSYDEVLGEEYCTQCGFIRVTKIFEDRPAVSEIIKSNLPTNAGLGGMIAHYEAKNKSSNRLARTDKMFGKRNNKDKALRTGLRECYMVLSYHSNGVDLDDVRRLVKHYYTRLYRASEMRGNSLIERACAIVFLTLRELEIPVTANEIGERHYVKPSIVSRNARKYARVLKKSHKLHAFNTQSWVDKTTAKLGTDSDFYYDLRRLSEFTERALENAQIGMTRTYFAGTVWLLNLMRRKNEVKQGDVCDACSISRTSLRNAYKRLLPIVNCEFEDLKNMTVDDFISGIRIR
tara:strand:+ start:2961 stop:3863 length:903 start_codon:yes stop_codon:yes gene_type:complete